MTRRRSSRSPKSALVTKIALAALALLLAGLALQLTGATGAKLWGWL